MALEFIDFRMRPPARSLLDGFYGSDERYSAYAEILHLPPSRAAVNRSIAQFWSEADAAGIKDGIVHARLGTTMGARAIPPVSNDAVAEAQREFPDRLIGVGSTYLGQPDMLAEVDRAIKELGLHGISVDPGLSYPPMYASSSAVCEVAEHCAELGVPLLVTTGINGGPDLSYADPVHLDRLAAACPKTTIVAAHGCWPYVQEICGVAFRRRNVYVSPDMYMMRCSGVSDYVAAINSFLADRFLFGTCYPSCPLQPLVDYYAELPIDDRVRPKIMFENAARLLKMA